MYGQILFIPYCYATLSVSPLFTFLYPLSDYFTTFVHLAYIERKISLKTGLKTYLDAVSDKTLKHQVSR